MKSLRTLTLIPLILGMVACNVSEPSPQELSSSSDPDIEEAQTKITPLVISTATEPPPPTPTLEPEFGMNEPVESTEWKVTVLEARYEGNEIRETAPTGKGFKTVTFGTDNPSMHLLRVKIELGRLNGEAIGQDYFAVEDNLRWIAVRDDEGNDYMFAAAGSLGSYYVVPEEGEQEPWYFFGPEQNIDYIFQVSKEAEVLDFLWFDLPPIRLQIETKEE